MNESVFFLLTRGFVNGNGIGGFIIAKYTKTKWIGNRTVVLCVSYLYHVQEVYHAIPI